MLKENGPPPGGKWADIAVLEPVRDYKARHASTMLTFDAVVIGDRPDREQKRKSPKWEPVFGQDHARRRLGYFAATAALRADRSAARSAWGLAQTAASRGRFCCAPVLPSRMPVTVWPVLGLDHHRMAAGGGEGVDQGGRHRAGGKGDASSSASLRRSDDTTLSGAEPARTVIFTSSSACGIAARSPARRCST